MKSSDSKSKVVALTLSFSKVPRTRADVPCASSEMRRKTAFPSRKTGQFLILVSRFDLDPPAQLEPDDVGDMPGEERDRHAHLGAEMKERWRSLARWGRRLPG